MKIEYNELVSDLEELLNEALKDLFADAKGNLKVFASDLAKQLAAVPYAPAEERQMILRSLLNSAKLLAEKQYQMVVNDGWDVFNAVVRALANFAVKVLA